MMGFQTITRARAEELRGIVRESSERERVSAFVVDGPHLVERALEAAPERIREIIFTEKASAENETNISVGAQKNIQLSQVSQKFAERISDTKSPQGIFAVVEMPEDDLKFPTDGILIALEDVQDPGNVGTIIRTASWFGASGIILSENCADPYSPKVLRATQGEIFSTKVGKRGDIENFLRILHKKDWQVLAATLDPAAGSLYKVAFKANVALVFGSEAHGISKRILGIADGQIIIPKFGNAESLNVATSVGIILSEIRRKTTETSRIKRDS